MCVSFQSIARLRKRMFLFNLWRGREQNTWPIVVTQQIFFYLIHFPENLLGLLWRHLRIYEHWSTQRLLFFLLAATFEAQFYCVWYMFHDILIIFQNAFTRVFNFHSHFWYVLVCVSHTSQRSCSMLLLYVPQVHGF